ncbi:MAG: hypothetical protein P4L84_33715 [Isosphaeraceae bacterium]|nr:hypothetical protein [Isosphaeraceae bacterium]
MLPSLRDPKARSEYPKELPVWLELDYFRRSRFLRTWRGGLSWGALALGVAVVAWLLGGTRDRRAFQAAPVSRVHRPINDDCLACHTRGFETAKRLWRNDAATHSVPDTACQQCHPGSIHHARELGETHCVSCHREHRGESLLAQLDQGTCTSCHADLTAHTASAKASDVERLIRNVSAFTTKGHPEFALWEAGAQDDGTVRFNHRKHLRPGGIPVGETRTMTVLACDRCHELDQGGRYMRPIDYSRHCRECHPLQTGLAGDFPDGPARQEWAVFVATPLQHPNRGETAASVRAELRERFTAFAQGHPEVLGLGLSAPPARPVPGARRPADEQRAEKEWAWVAEQLRRAEPPLFDSKAGCLYCHTETTKPSDRPGGLPAYAAPAIKERWLPHSVFKHETHRALDCEQCHAGASKSEQTSAVLMPRIAACQQCHKPDASAARADCAECHVYHNPVAERSWKGRFTIEQFFQGHAPPRNAAGSK